MLAQPEIKYCGNHSLEDLQTTTHSKAHYIGIVFAESKRRADPKQAADWLKKAPLDAHQRLAGLFVNPSLEEIHLVIKEVPLDIIQCHGTETRERIAAIKSTFSLPVWKAIHHDVSALKQMKEYAGAADGYVVDCKVKGKWGGTGESFDWKQVPFYTEEAKRQDVQCFIAGGIQPDNVRGLLRYKPDGIDLSSGIEHDGKKNPEKITRLEERIFQYGTRLS